MSFVFIDTTFTGSSALDATPITRVDTISGIFVEQTEQFSFFVGNTGTLTSEYTFLASGINTDTIGCVSFSLDGINWEDEVSVSGVRPKELTPLIRCSFTPTADIGRGITSFLVHCDEVTHG